MDLTKALHEWHDFYLMVGAASGALLGAMFVVASIASGFLTPERMPRARAFVTPTVVNVSSVVIACAVLLTPVLSWPRLTALTGAASLAGLIYAGVIGRQVWHREIDPSDRVWHGLVPPGACVMMAVAAVLAFQQRELGLDVLAAALLVLLIAAIRNAWDLIVFFVSRPRG
ncbi:MAG: hypothetical protein ACREF3_08190 [Acetobacteraceae bacterium]